MTQKKHQPEIQPITAEEISPPMEESTSEVGEEKPLTPEETTVPLRRAYGYWILTLFVVFTGSLVSVSWYGWKLFETNAARLDSLMATQQRDQRALADKLEQTNGQMSQLSANWATQEKKTGEQITQTQQTTGKLSERLTALEHNLAAIQNRLGQGERAWKAAEIGFLLTRAQERLSIAQDPAGAAVALKLADQRLAALALPQTLPIRAAISDALIQLGKVDDFDAVGMALRLRRAAENVSQWPLIGAQTASATTEPIATVVTESTASTTTTANEPWYVRWPRAVWHPVAVWFSRQFTLTRSDQAVKESARASDDRETRLWLTAVREGLLSHDMHQMMSSIVEAQDWIAQHYAPDAPDVSQTLAALKATQDFYMGRQWPSFAPIFKAWDTSGLKSPTATSPIVQEAQP
ncbi:uroporphyrinogen-III C-methyltransferase [Halothiobacillus sp.]|uniref:uroporphyrinogen-III C-methyltransferase n=1 Tax=Halothiobacillus sp. TaxID=1891311 RepID=UPI0026218CCE|nr:uroporphyrinogen-III C-methyltransferase [Halothiobacillus sp.]